MSADERTQINKRNVQESYDLMFNQCRPAQAIQRYAGDTYIQHNPHVGDGKQAFLDYFESPSRGCFGAAAWLDSIRFERRRQHLRFLGTADDQCRELRSSTLSTLFRTVWSDPKARMSRHDSATRRISGPVVIQCGSRAPSCPKPGESTRSVG